MINVDTLVQFAPFAALAALTVFCINAGLPGRAYRATKSATATVFSTLRSAAATPVLLGAGIVVGLAASAWGATHANLARLPNRPIRTPVEKVELLRTEARAAYEAEWAKDDARWEEARDRAAAHPVPAPVGYAVLAGGFSLTAVSLVASCLVAAFRSAPD